MSISFTFQSSGHKVHQGSLDGVLWYRGNDVATLLGYAMPRSAIRDHVREDDKRQLCEVCSSVLAAGATRNDMKTIYINEAGVKRLVVKSQKPQASDLAKQLEIKEETRYLRKEIELLALSKKC